MTTTSRLFAEDLMAFTFGRYKLFHHYFTPRTFGAHFFRSSVPSIFTIEIGKLVDNFARANDATATDIYRNYQVMEHEDSSTVKARFVNRLLELGKQSLPPDTTMVDFFKFCGHIQNLFLHFYRSGNYPMVLVVVDCFDLILNEYHGWKSRRTFFQYHYFAKQHISVVE